MNVAVLPWAERVTAVPPRKPSTSLRALSAVQATSANWVVTRWTTAGPCASICRTIAATCVSAIPAAESASPTVEMLPLRVVPVAGSVREVDPVADPDWLASPMVGEVAGLEGIGAGGRVGVPGVEEVAPGEVVDGVERVASEVPGVCREALLGDVESALEREVVSSALEVEVELLVVRSDWRDELELDGAEVVCALSTSVAARTARALDAADCRGFFMMTCPTGWGRSCRAWGAVCQAGVRCRDRPRSEEVHPRSQTTTFSGNAARSGHGVVRCPAA